LADKVITFGFSSCCASAIQAEAMPRFSLSLLDEVAHTAWRA
jgi:hypothetical protein